MVWQITKEIILYYDGVCAWLIYGKGCSRCETLLPID